MYLDLKRKVVVSIVGIVFLLVFALFFPWWLFLLALFAYVPAFYKLLRA